MIAPPCPALHALPPTRFGIPHALTLVQCEFMGVAAQGCSDNSCFSVISVGLTLFTARSRSALLQVAGCMVASWPPWPPPPKHHHCMHKVRHARRGQGIRVCNTCLSLLKGWLSAFTYMQADMALDLGSFIHTLGHNLGEEIHNAWSQLVSVRRT